MRVLSRIVTGGGVAAFFFFSWVIMMLWNSIVAAHLGLTAPLSYLQTCGLWFMVTLFLAWTGIGVGWRSRMSGRVDRGGEEFGRNLERRIKGGLGRWVGAENDLDWDELGERIEKKIKSRFKEWLAEGGD